MFAKVQKATNPRVNVPKKDEAPLVFHINKYERYYPIKEIKKEKKRKEKKK